MKNKVSIYTLALSLFAPSLIYAEALTSADLYWVGGQTSASDISRWSTSKTEVINPVSIDYANTVFGFMDTQASQIAIPYEIPYIKGIYLQSQAYGLAWYAETSSFEVGNITKIGESSLILRNKDANGNFALTVGEVNAFGTAESASNVSLGYSQSTGEYLESLRIKNCVNLADNNILNIASSHINFDAGSSINLNNNGSLIFINYEGENASGHDAYKETNVDLRNVKINIGSNGGNQISYGTNSKAFTTGKITFGDINISSRNNVNNTIPVQSMQDVVNFGKITTLSDSGEWERGISTTTFDTGGANANMKFVIDSIQTSAGRFYFANQTEITKNLQIMNTVADGIRETLSVISLGTNNTFSIGGELVFENAVKNNYISTGIKFTNEVGCGDISVSIAGISGGTQSGIQDNRVTTAYISSDTRTEFILNGSGTYEFKGRVHDMTYSSTRDDISELGNYAALSLTKNGSGTQILSGENYIRGNVTVNSGALYVSATNSYRMGDIWGLNKIVLNGGKFGAIGYKSEKSTGLIYATQIEFAGGVLDFDINNLNPMQCDIIDFTPGQGASNIITFANGADKLTLNFNSNILKLAWRTKS